MPNYGGATALNIQVSTGIAGTGGAAAVDLGSWYFYRSTTGAYYGVNVLTGAATYTHATDIKSVWDSVLGVMPGTSATTNNARSGGRIEFGPHVFNTSGPLAVTNKRSLTVVGQGCLQQTIIQQAAEFSTGRGVMEIGTSADSPILQGFDYSGFQIRGDRTTYTFGGGMVVYCSLGYFHDIGIQDVNQTAFYLNGTASGAQTAFTTVVDRLHISGFGKSGAHTAKGIFFDIYVSDCDIMNCDVHQDTEAHNLTHGTYGFHVKAGTSRLFNNHAYFCYDYGYYFDYAGNVSLIDCISESNGAEGLYLNGPDGVKIIGGGYYSNGQRTSVANIYMANSRQFSIAALHMAKYRTTTVNPSRNIQIDTCSNGRITDCTFADADNDHIMIAGTGTASTQIDISQCEFLDGITYSPTTGSTPGDAIHLYTISTNIKVHDNIIAGTTMGITEDASGWAGNYNEYYHNKLGDAASIVMQDGTTFTSRKWGNRNLTGVLWPDRIYGGKGADVSSENDMKLLHGRMFQVTGTTQVNGIRTAGWDSGVEIYLRFTGAVLVKNNTAPSAGYGKIFLVGAGDFTSSATDILSLVFDGTDFYETGRNVI